MNTKLNTTSIVCNSVTEYNNIIPLLHPFRELYEPLSGHKCVLWENCGDIITFLSYINILCLFLNPVVDRTVWQAVFDPSVDDH